MNIFQKISVRGFKLSLTLFSVTFFAVWTLIEPGVWAINLIIWPIAAIVVFDRGHAKTIDITYRAIKHLKGKSDQADLTLVLLGQENLKLVRTKLLLLGVDFPEDKEAIEKAIVSIDGFLAKKPWWHF